MWADIDAGGWVGLLVGAAGTLAALWMQVTKILSEQRSKLREEEARQKTEEAKQRTADLDYIIGQYKATVERVRKEHDEDRALLTALQASEAHCRERQAAQQAELEFLRGRLEAQQKELDFLKNRLIVQQGGQP